MARRRPTFSTPAACLACALGIVGAGRSPARADAPPPAAPCASCVVWSASPTAAARLLALEGSIAGVEVVVRSEAGEAGGGALVEELLRRGARAGLETPLEAEGETARALPREAARLQIRIPSVPPADADRVAFRIKQTAVAARASAPAVSIGLAGPASALAVLSARGGLAAYLDFVVADDDADADAFADGGPERWRRAAAPRSLAGLLDATRTAHGHPLLVDLPLEAERWVPALASLRALIPADLSPLGSVSLQCAPPGSECGEVFLHPETLDAVAILPGAGPRALRIAPGATRVEGVRLTDGGGAVPFAAAVRRAGAAAEIDLGESAGYVLRVAGWTGRGESFATGVEVRARRSLTVEEIVAAHQAAAARQARRVRTLIASGSTVLTFQVPGLAAPMTLTARTVEYRGPDVVEVEQKDIRLNGASVPTGGDAVPRLPLVEPERVAAPPLSITLGEKYRYRLAGREVLGARECYVVAFTPHDESVSTFRGRAWITVADFALARVDAVQTGLRGAIVSSRQVDEFAAGAGGGWTLSRSETHQVYEGPAHRTPIDRVVTVSGTEINAPGFVARRAAARASNSVMLRETPEGYRYLRRAPPSARTRTTEDASLPSAAAEAEEPTRTIAGRATSVRTVAVGLLVDPNISHPLPFAGLSYLDLDFLGTGAQVSAFAAGPFVQGAWTVPSLHGPAWRLQGSLFASLIRYNDRVFVGGRERYEENLRQRPIRVSMAVVRRLGGRSRVRLAYDGEAVLLERAQTTASDFVMPPDPVVHGLRFALEAERGAWSAAAWGSAHRRQRWSPWGLPDSPAGREGGRDFQRAGASLARTFVASSGWVGRIEASALTGRRLDRFSRFGFDAFDNRLRGYPSALLRFDRGAVLRTALTRDAHRGLRLDGFADGALVRDPTTGPRARGYLGVGAAVELALPGRALLLADWGYGAQARDAEGRRGTHVFRVTAYKVF